MNKNKNKKISSAPIQIKTCSGSGVYQNTYEIVIPSFRMFA